MGVILQDAYDDDYGLGKFEKLGDSKCSLTGHYKVMTMDNRATAVSYATYNKIVCSFRNWHISYIVND